MDRLINNCRLCSSNKLNLIFNFGNVPIGNNLPDNIIETNNIKKYPLKVIKCEKCNHFQLSVSINPEILYATNYTYLSGIGKSFLKHIKHYVHWIDKNCKIKNKKFVLDIGSNDGTCLNEFKKLGYKVCGVDPAQMPSELANKKGIFTYNEFFTVDTAKKISKRFGKPSIITSQNALAHIDNLYETFKQIYDLLDQSGYFIFEVGYFLSVLENRLFDTIYHEHIDYHHALPLVRHLCNVGFSAIKIEIVESQGGSLRLLLKKNGKNDISKEVKEFIDEENNSSLHNKDYLNSWLTKIKSQLYDIRTELIKKKKQGFEIVAYGAPTKATLLLKLSNLTKEHINYVVEDNKLKVGKFLPNGMPIRSSNCITRNSKKVIFVLAWNFAEDIIKKLRQKNIKADIIIPLPLIRRFTI